MTDSIPAIETASRPLRRAIFLVSFPVGILMFVLPFYGRTLGASALEVGGLFSAFSVVTLLLRPIVGRALDRYGRRLFLMAGVACYAGAMIVYMQAQDVTLLYLARIVQGLGNALMWLSAYTIIADSASPDQRGNQMGRLDEATSRGALSGAFIGFMLLGPLGVAAGWPLIFSVYAALALAGLIVAWRGLPETRPPTTDPRRPMRQVLTRPLLVLMAIVSITGASQAMITPLLVIFLQDRFHTTPFVLGLAFIPSALIWALLPSRMGRLADRFGRKPLMMTGLAMGGLVSFFFPRIASIAQLILLWAAEAVFQTASVPAEEALVADMTGHQVRGTAYGLYTLAASGGAVVGPLVGGWLYDSAGHAAPFNLNAIFLVLGASLILLFVRDTRQAHSP
jgi:DHA1 family multidrug resistance protein-like MFS transporter